MSGGDLGLEAFGYGANAGDPMGFWRRANAGTQQAVGAANLTNLQAAYQGMVNKNTATDMQGQQDADKILPGIIMALGDNGQTPTPGGGPDVSAMPAAIPMPSSPSGPFRGAQGDPQGGPQGGPPPQGAGGTPPQMQQVAGGPTPLMGAPPPGMNAPAPQQAPQQQMAPPGPQQPGQAQPGRGYDIQDVVRIIKTQYPNIEGPALRNVLTTINPMILTPQAKMQVQMMKMQMEQQKLPIMQENADSRRTMAGTGIANNQTRQTQQFGRQMIPTPPMPGGMPGRMGPGAQQMSNDGVPPLNASSLGGNPQAPGGGNPQVAPTVGPQAQIAMAKQQQKGFETFNTQRPLLEQTLVDTGSLLEGLKDAPTIDGAGSSFITSAANWLSTLTGDQSFADRAAQGQIQGKEIADLVIGRVGSLTNTGTRTFGTDMGKQFVAQSKPSAEMQPAAFANVLRAGVAPVVGKMMEQDYLQSMAQKNGGVYLPQDRSYLEGVSAKFPFFSRQGSKIFFNPDNVRKAKAALAKRAGEDFTHVDDYTDSVLGGATAASTPEAADASKPQDSNRPLTREEMEEYKRLGGT